MSGQKTDMSTQKDPIEVFCRVRPLQNNEESCVEILSDKVLQINAPVNQKGIQSRVEQLQCTFNKVLNEDVTQMQVFEHVGLPLVQDLLLGKNGLCFMYGITGSGKTFTMNGEPSDGGVLPRSLDCIFNSIKHLQTPRCTFKPDCYNGFTIVSDVDSEVEARTKCSHMRGLLNKIDNSGIPRNPDHRCLEVDNDNNYAVFVSFLEIYNNAVYDLLEDEIFDEFKQPKPPGSKILREDKKGEIFAYQVSEVEVKNTEEAFGMFIMGHQRRKIAHTLLNTESSRSHCVFTIKLIQAPLGPNGDAILKDSNLISVSQLSLCDLAGSERNNRTQVEGEKARQAGHINNSLMTLRSCIEALRENQGNAGNKIVPYRESKLTHLFRNYFDGAGGLKMIVCLNPRTDDFDESLHVMRFAEITKEVRVPRAEVVKFDLGLTPGRGKAHADFKAKGEECLVSSRTTSPDSIIAPFQQFSPWPSLELAGHSDSSTLKGVMHYLEGRSKLRKTLYTDWQHKQAEVRRMILQLEQDNIDLTKAMEEQRAILVEKEREAKSYEKRIKTLNEKYENLQKSTQSYESEKREWSMELEKTKDMVQQERQKKSKIKQTLKELTSNERLRWEKECQKRVHDKEVEMQEQVLRKNEKLRQLRDVVKDLQLPKENQIRLSQIISGQRQIQCHNVSTLAHKYEHDICHSVGQNIPGNCHASGHSQQTTENYQASGHSQETTGSCQALEHITPDLKKSKKSTHTHPRGQQYTSPRNKNKVRSRSPLPAISRKNDVAPVVGKHRRSRSTDFWLNHKPAETLTTGTIMQPWIRNKKTVKTPGVKDLKVIPNYILTHQEEDSAGEIETQLIKGEVHHTRGGGSSVQFTDIETLKKAYQEKATPTKTPTTEKSSKNEHVRTPKSSNNKGTPKSKTRKRKSLENGTPSSGSTVEDRCSAGIEAKAGCEPGLRNHCKNKKIKS